jgi:hypothetical protein
MHFFLNNFIANYMHIYTLYNMHMLPEHIVHIYTCVTVAVFLVIVNKTSVG